MIRRLLNDANLAPPMFDSDRGRDEFTATFFLHNLLDEDDLTWLGTFSDLNLSTDEAKALVHVREAGQISNSVYRDLNGVDTLEASSHLRRLRDLRLLQQHDRGAATYYTPAARFHEAASSAGELGDRQSREAAEKSDDGVSWKSDDLHEKSAILAEKSDDLHEKSAILAEKSDDLDKKSAVVDEKSDDLEDNDSDGNGRQIVLPAELSDAVGRLSQWTPQPELRRLIQRLCAWRPMSTSDLSRILKRSRTYLRTSYVGPMVKAGELEYTNPGKPNDPSQSYRAARIPGAGA